MNTKVLDARPTAEAKLGRKNGSPIGLRSSAMVVPQSLGGGAPGAECACVELADTTRAALTLTPRSRGIFREQLQEVLSVLKALLDRRTEPMAATMLTVFLRRAKDRAECERSLAAWFGPRLPVVSYVLQPPCCGAALAMEVWAIGGKRVVVERLRPQVLAVTYEGVRWIYCGGIQSASPLGSAYAQTVEVLGRTAFLLESVGSSFEQVLRTWFYLGGITEPEAEGVRYQQLNGARADFYRGAQFYHSMPRPGGPPTIYPASTGIGVAGLGLTLSCLALETQRKDVRLVALENPNQTPAYDYQAKYSRQSPRFSRAMALVQGDYTTIWISGTASVVGSESCHLRDLERQTEQTISNIEQLIAPKNFDAHGLSGVGAGLRDLAKIRVYLKRPEDLEQCREICERRFGAVPAIYAVADICRPELLVEIEGVAFSRNQPRRRNIEHGTSNVEL